MFNKFFHRPALTISISVAIVFLGILAMKSLPVSQFPDVAPPRVYVFLKYPGANARTLVNSTLIPLERAINGVQDMLYMSSDATSAGEAVIQIIFKPGTNANLNVVNVKTRVDAIANNLPVLVRREGIIVLPIQPSMLMYVNIYIYIVQIRIWMKNSSITMPILRLFQNYNAFTVWAGRQF